jgi:hypothetical protein
LAASICEFSWFWCFFRLLTLIEGFEFTKNTAFIWSAQSLEIWSISAKNRFISLQDHKRKITSVQVTTDLQVEVPFENLPSLAPIFWITG